jgi:RNA polymerase sigma-70 factor (ECF subfamily)
MKRGDDVLDQGMTIDGSIAPSPAARATRWLEDHGDALYSYALARVRDPHVAEDLVQETLLAGLAAAGGFMGWSAERTWLTGILKHKLADHLRRALRERPPRPDGPDGLDEMFAGRGNWKVSPSNWSDDPQALAERAEFRLVLAQCLSRLPARMAQAFWMREAENVETAELCRRLSVTPVNFWALLHRARTGLRKCLGIHWFDGDQPR